MKNRIIIVISVIVFSGFMVSCNNEDESIAPTSVFPQDSVIGTNGFNVTLGGEDYITSMPVIEHNDTTVEIRGIYGETTVADIYMGNPLDEGIYMTNDQLGFQMRIGFDIWFCRDSCTFSISEHNPSTGRLSGNVSGVLSNLAGTGFVNLANASFTVNYIE